MSRGGSRLFTALAGLALACAGTETTNPSTDQDQSIENRAPIDFHPAPDVPSCPLPNINWPPQAPRWVHRAGVAVGLGAKGDLWVMDASRSGAVQHLATLPLKGDLLAAQFVTDKALAVVVERGVSGPMPTPPSPESAKASLSVVRVDLSELTAPRVVAEWPLQGSFWALRTVAQSVWLMTARLSPRAPRCRDNMHDCSYPERGAFVVQELVFEGSDWAEGQKAELPTAGAFAWVGERVFATLVSPIEQDAGELAVARVTPQGVLHAVPSVPLPHSVSDGAAVRVHGDQIWLPGASDDSAALGPVEYRDSSKLMRVDVSGSPQVFNQVLDGLPEMEKMLLSPELNPGDTVTVLEFQHLAPPFVLVEQTDGSYALGALPAPFLHAAPLPSVQAERRVLAWYPAADESHTVLALVDVAGTVQELARATVPLPLSQVGRQPTIRVVHASATRQWLTGVPDPAQGWWSTAFAVPVEVGDAALTVGPLAEHNGWFEAVAAGEQLLVGNEFEVGALTAAGASTTALADNVLDAAHWGSAPLQLTDLWYAPEGPQVKLVGESASTRVAEGAQRLLQIDEQLVVFGTASEDCGLAGEPCIITRPFIQQLQPGPTLAADAPTPAPFSDLWLAQPPGVDISANLEHAWEPEQLWPPSVVRLHVKMSCTTSAGCDAVGLKEPVADGSPAPIATIDLVPDCPPDGSPCTPPERPELYRSRQEFHHFVVAAGAGSTVEWTAIEPLLLRDRERIVGSAQVLGEQLWVSTARPVLDQQGASSSTAASPGLADYYAQALPARGIARAAVPPLPVPGQLTFVRARDAEAHLWTVAPDGRDGAVLSRVLLSNGEASVVEQLPLPGWLADYHATELGLLYLEEPADGCAEGPSFVHAVSLEPTLRIVGSTQLEGVGWRFATSRDGTVALTGPEPRTPGAIRGVALLSQQTGAAPIMLGFYALPTPSSVAHNLHVSGSSISGGLGAAGSFLHEF